MERTAKNTASMQKKHAHTTPEEQEETKVKHVARWQHKCAHAAPKERREIKAKNTANRQKKRARATSEEREFDEHDVPHTTVERIESVKKA